MQNSYSVTAHLPTLLAAAEPLVTMGVRAIRRILSPANMNVIMRTPLVI